MLSPIINYLAARGMIVQDRSYANTYVLHITTADNNKFFLTIDNYRPATVQSDGRIYITNNFLRDAQALDIAKDRAYRLVLKEG